MMLESNQSSLKQGISDQSPEALNLPFSSLYRHVSSSEITQRLIAFRRTMVSTRDPPECRRFFNIYLQPKRKSKDAYRVLVKDLEKERDGQTNRKA